MSDETSPFSSPQILPPGTPSSVPYTGNELHLQMIYYRSICNTINALELRKDGLKEQMDDIEKQAHYELSLIRFDLIQARRDRNSGLERELLDMLISVNEFWRAQYEPLKYRYLATCEHIEARWKQWGEEIPEPAADDSFDSPSLFATVDASPESLQWSQEGSPESLSSGRCNAVAIGSVEESPLAKRMENINLSDDEGAWNTTISVSSGILSSTEVSPIPPVKIGRGSLELARFPFIRRRKFEVFRDP